MLHTFKNYYIISNKGFVQLRVEGLCVRLFIEFRIIRFNSTPKCVKTGVILQYSSICLQHVWDTHAVVSNFCPYQLMEDTQGNQKPHKNSTQGLGVEIFYKPSRNVVPAEYTGKTRKCVIGIMCCVQSCTLVIRYILALNDKCQHSVQDRCLIVTRVETYSSFIICCLMNIGYWPVSVSNHK